MLRPLIDDPEIADDDIVYRRVGWAVVGDVARLEPGQTAPLHRNAFSDYSTTKAQELGYAGPCMSVGLGSAIQERGLTPAKAMLDGYPGYGLASLLVRDLRKAKRADGTPCPQGILHSPTDAEPWHAVVFDLANLEALRPRSATNALAQAARWVVPLIAPGAMPNGQEQ